MAFRSCLEDELHQLEAMNTEVLKISTLELNKSSAQDTTEQGYHSTLSTPLSWDPVPTKETCKSPNIFELLQQLMSSHGFILKLSL